MKDNTKDDEQRYAEYLAQQQADDQEEDNPLEEVRKIRAEQLAACDLKKHQEMAKMRKDLQEGSRKTED